MEFIAKLKEYEMTTLQCCDDAKALGGKPRKNKDL